MTKLIQIGTASFPKRKNLRQQWEFAFVRARATTSLGKYMVLKVVDAPNSITKVGIIISKRCHKSAVKRNRAKRLLRESFRLIAEGITPPKWFVIIARKKILVSSLSQVQTELVDLLVKANAFSHKNSP